MVPMDKWARDDLRRYKSQDGRTYTEAIGDLLEEAGWYDHPDRERYDPERDE